MTPMELITELQKQDIRLHCVGDTLRVDAPQGVLTPELRETLREQKAALLEVLSEPPEPSPERCACGAEAAYHSDRGVPTCEKHRFQYVRAHCAAAPALAFITQTDFFLQDIAHLADLFAGQDRLALDLETTGLDPQAERVVSIAIGVPGQVAVLDMRPFYALPAEDQDRWKAALLGLLHREGVTWIGHNLTFDWQFLTFHFAVKIPAVYDTMLVEQLLYGIGLGNARLSLKLKDVAGRYSLPVSKEERQWFPGLHLRTQEWGAPFPVEQLRYMVQDIEIPFHIATQQQAKIAEHSLESVVALEHGALPALAAMELRGVLVDAERWRGILAHKRVRMHQLEQTLHAELGKALQQACTTYQQGLQVEERRLMHAYQASPGKSTWPRFRGDGMALWEQKHPRPPFPKVEGTIKLSSAPQLQAALAVLGVQVDSTREGVLEPYAATMPLIADLLEWKTLEKFCSSFGENILARLGADGRIHTDYAQIGAVSGRIISRSPNLQQIPAHDTAGVASDVVVDAIDPIRSCFVAPPGACLLTADLSNIELRILAEVSQDKTMLRLFAEGKDLHAETAKLMFGLPADTNTKTQLYKGNVSVRAVAKTINFGLAYGMGAQGLANRVGVGVEDAKALMQTYFRTYAGVASWLRATGRRAMQQGYAATLSGRKRWFPTSTLDTALRASFERAAKNHPIQGTNADIMKRALALLHAELPEEAHLLLTVHDEVVVECPEACADAVAQCMKACMVRACRDFLTVVHIPSPEVMQASFWKKD